MNHFFRRGVALGLLAMAMVAATLGVAPGQVSAQANTPSFTRSVLQGETNSAPTAIEFGPDGKLYVADVDGIVKVYEVQKNGDNDYSVTSTETITRVANITNHDDDGSVTTDPEAIGKRQVTGIRVGGTAQNPILYVSNSDPRIAEQGGNTPLDTNSGIVSRLTQTTPGTWAGAAKVDLVRGLPRNEENHAVNGMELSSDGNTMYLAVGGNTNKGAPSSSFAFQWEYALSAAILDIDLSAIDALPLQPPGCDPTTTDCYIYDVPTLDDPDRPNVGATNVDQGDPFGGNSEDNGSNQAMLVPGGPVQLHAVGFRNAYDVLLREDGRMFSVDNGGNNGWGGLPGNEGPAGNCDNSINNNGGTHGDALHYVRETTPGQLYYGGHPNPLRGNPDDIVPTTNWSGSPYPISMTNPIECDFQGPTGNGPILDNGALEVWSHSTNGMAEYTASNFGGAWQGDILSAGWSGRGVERVKVSFDGNDNPTVLESDEPLVSAGFPLDLDTRGDAETFPGTVWVAQFFGSIEIFEPDDNVVCGGPPGADDDSDGYINSDEVDNGTDPCSAASIPPDADGDFTSDLNDPDDDNDGTPDVTDAFAIDASNGLNQALPLDLQWEQPVDGILGLGFKGLMTNGSDPWSTQYDEGEITAIGAAGVLTVDDIGTGTAEGTANDQRYGFQVGVDPCGSCTAYRVSSVLSQPLQEIANPTTESMGVFAGTGDQSNYVKAEVVPGPTGNGGVRLVVEENDVITSDVFTPAPTVLTGSLVRLNIDIDPSGTATASYQVDGGGEVSAGGPVNVPGGWSTGGAALAVGILSSSGGAPAFGGTWASLEVDHIAGSGTGAWNSLAPADDARHENSLVEVNNKVYLIGGRGSTTPVEVYDPTTDQWTTATPPPVQMHHFQAVAWNDLIYVVGGMTGIFPTETPLPNVYIYDPAEDRWIEGPEIPSNRRRGSGGVVVHDDLIYFVGGIQNGHQSGTVGWTDVFDPATGVWTALPNDMANPRDHVSAAVVGDKIYVAGGRVTTQGNIFGNTISDVEVYDITAGTWSTLPDPIPTERAAAAVGVLGTEVLVIGGESGSLTQAHSEVEALDAISETWRTLEPLPSGEDRHGTSAAVIDCRLYVAAGSGSRGGGPELTSALSFEFGPCPIPQPGTGVLNAAPSTVDFGTVGVGGSPSLDVTISNPGASILTITSAGIIGGDAGVFSAGGSYPLQVPAGGNVTVPVTFTPAAEETYGSPDNHGDTSAALAVIHDGGHAVTVPLTGIGGAGGGDTPITGLTVNTNGPVVLGGPTTATASIFTGTNVSYDWDMGDGTTFTDAGPSVSHSYAATGTYTVTVTASNSVSSENAQTSTVVQDTPAGGQILINSGGSSFQDNLGRTWSADTSFVGGNIYSRGAPISGTTNDTLYQSERYGNFSYDIPVAGAGCYDITLHFAELWFGSRGGGGDGSRVFSVDLEDIEVLLNYDIHAAVGPLTATTESFQIQINDSVIDLDFTSQVNNAKISAIEIASAGGTCGADDPITGLTLSNDGPTPLGSPTGFTAAVTTGTNVTYDWDFGDGTTVTDGGATQSHTYTSMGTYTATVTASNSVTTGETATGEVTVTNTGDAPITGLSLTNDGPTDLGSATGFTASVTGGTNITYDWDFGDGTTLNDGGPTPSHTYANLGSYTATVTASNTVGSDSTTSAVTVQNAPVAGLSVASSGPVEIGVAATLTASVTGGTNLSYDWDFGDGNTATDAGPVVNHSYGSDGSFTVEVTASNDVSNDTATTTQTVTSGPDDPITGLTATSGGQVPLGTPSTFTASITGGTNVVYNWDFGDGTTLNDGGPTPSHTYGSTGSYTVSVQAVNGVSNANASTSASVVDEAIAGLSVSNDGPVLLGGPISFSATITAGTDVTYDWDFGDGTTLNDGGSNPSHTYGSTGSYVVSVTATNLVNSASDSTVAVVNAAPAFTYRVNSGGGAYTDGSAQVWQADVDFNGGKTYSRGAPIAGTTDDTLYQTERYGNFSYNIPVPTVACYDVTLHFAELYFGSRAGGTGSRVFDVDIEGTEVLGSYDIHADVGPLTATTYTFAVQVVDPTLDIVFNSQVNNAKISAIEVALAGATCDPDDPITGLSLSDNSPTQVGSPTQLIATISGGTNITYDWDFGDGTIELDQGPAVNHIYASAGSYTATVTASNNGSFDQATTSVTVTSAPDDPITGLAVSNDGPTELGSQTSFNATVTGGTNVVYDWDFGDGNTLIGQGPSVTHTYGSIGSFSASVTARNGAGSTSAPTTADVTDVPITGLSAASGGSVVVGNPANLTASISGGTNVVYDWDFGDGNSQSNGGTSVSHTYASPGSYTVTVTANNSTSSNVTATATQLVTSQPDDPITGLSVSNGGPVDLGVASSFTASITGGTNVTYNWDFGDGNSQTDGGASVNHTYATPGSYTVTVTAVNGAGSDSASTVGVVNDTAIAGLSAGNDGPVAVGAAVELSATVTAGTNVSYSWDFGDGNTGSGATIDHTYAAVGTYVATVTATNSAGTDSATTTVTVEDVAVTGLAITPDPTLFVNSAAGFTATVATGTGLSYDWVFGDGTSLNGTGSVVSHTYTAPGSYTVSVTASNGISSESASVQVTVDAEPAFEVRINSGGAEYTDTQSQVWEADNYFVGGKKYTRTVQIANTNDDPLYQTERYRNFSYAIPVPAAGCYQVALHMAELWWGGPPAGGGDGSRVFDVSIEGSLVLDDHDIHAATGPKTAMVLTFDQQVTDSTLDILFQTEVNNAKISGVHVLRLGASCS